MATFHGTTIEKEIKYNRANRDYDCYVGGQYVGSRSTYSDGETLCNEVAYDLISSGACYTTTDLDAVVQLPAFVGKISSFLAK